jgi:sRNA-binding regulator protein Hfq
LAEPKERSGSASRSSVKTAAAPKKQTPPETTNAENFYYVKQMQSKTPMVVVLRDGESLHGIIEWYDKSCIKLTREDGPNLLVYKSFIKYLYKANEGSED